MHELHCNSESHWVTGQSFIEYVVDSPFAHCEKDPWLVLDLCAAANGPTVHGHPEHGSIHLAS
eukprot:4063296-Amphidinium_carterae.1